MRIINWKMETGITEVQWLQGIAAIIVWAVSDTEYKEMAVHAGLMSQFILGAIGWVLQLRSKSRQKDTAADLQREHQIEVDMAYRDGRLSVEGVMSDPIKVSVDEH